MEAEVARWCDEARKLQADMDGKPLVFLCCPSLYDPWWTIRHGWYMFWAGLDHRPRVEVTKSHSLEKELDEVKATLLKQSDEHDALRVVVQLVCDNLELALM